MATNMATPPAWGVTRWCTLRSSGWATYPTWAAIRRAGKVGQDETTMATARQHPYQLSGTPAIIGGTLRGHVPARVGYGGKPAHRARTSSRT